jgi:hypothetical protein
VELEVRIHLPAFASHSKTQGIPMSSASSETSFVPGFVPARFGQCANEVAGRTVAHKMEGMRMIWPRFVSSVMIRICGNGSARLISWAF